jgi:hypothetical protein
MRTGITVVHGMERFVFKFDMIEDLQGMSLVSMADVSEARAGAEIQDRIQQNLRTGDRILGED